MRFDPPHIAVYTGITVYCALVATAVAALCWGLAR